MFVLTPELWLLSALSGNSDVSPSNAIDLNLARRSAMVINRIVSQAYMHPDTLTGNESSAVLIQEVDVDPDNLVVDFLNVDRPTGVITDSSRCLRHVQHFGVDTATGGVGIPSPGPILVKDWSHMPMEQRPISITNLRHHVRATADISQIMDAEVAIDYFIVELTLVELGMLNASRR